MDEDEFIESAPPAAQSVRQDNAEAEQVRLSLKQAYANVFSVGNTDKDSLRIVVDDLAKFGRFFDSTVPPAGGALNWSLEVYEGRRQVFCRIMEHVHISLPALMKRYHGHN